MKKFIVLCVCVLLTACAPKKPRMPDDSRREPINVTAPNELNHPTEQ